MKSSCTLTEPPTRINGKLVVANTKPVSRSSAAQYLRSCRQGKAKVLHVCVGRYSILPLGLDHGFRLTTR